MLSRVGFISIVYTDSFKKKASTSRCFLEYAALYIIVVGAVVVYSVCVDI